MNVLDPAGLAREQELYHALEKLGDAIRGLPWDAARDAAWHAAILGQHARAIPGWLPMKELRRIAGME
jgi:hypothetical protein